MKKTDPVSPSYLLRGLWYAFEQAGHLLNAAITLYAVKQYSPALALSQFGREELGKARLILDLWRDVNAGHRNVNLEQLEAACDDHKKKQKRALLAITFSPSPDTALGKALRTLTRAMPGSHEYEEADKVIKDATESKAARLPNDRGLLRMQALYVDPTADGAGWNRPTEIAVETVSHELLAFAGDYSLQLDKITHRQLDDRYPGLSEALNAWTDKPELPPPSEVPFP